MAKRDTAPRKRDPEPDPALKALERAAMVGILLGVVLSTGASLFSRSVLGLPYVALFSTYFFAAFGGYAAWVGVQRWDVAPLGYGRGDVLAWCLLAALGTASVFTVGVGLLGQALGDPATANAAMLPVVAGAYLLLRRWMRDKAA